MACEIVRFYMNIMMIGINTITNNTKAAVMDPMYKFLVYFRCFAVKEVAVHLS